MVIQKFYKNKLLFSYFSNKLINSMMMNRVKYFYSQLEREDKELI